MAEVDDVRFPAGWGWPGLASKAHYFPVGSMASLCGRWLFSGERYDEEHEHRDNCVTCMRARLKLVKRAAKHG